VLLNQALVPLKNTLHSNTAFCATTRALLPLQIQPNQGDVHEMRAQVLNAEGKTYEALQAAQQVRLSIWGPPAHPFDYLILQTS
jgi:hypothetical protein